MLKQIKINEKKEAEENKSVLYNYKIKGDNLHILSPTHPI